MWGAGGVKGEVFEAGAARGGVQGTDLGLEKWGAGGVGEGEVAVAIRGEGSGGGVYGGGLNPGEDGGVAKALGFFGGKGGEEGELKRTELNFFIPGGRGVCRFGGVCLGFGLVLVLAGRVRPSFSFLIVPEPRGMEPVNACKLGVGEVWVAVCNSAVELDGSEVPRPGAEVGFCGVFGVEWQEGGEGGGASDIGVVGKEVVDFALGLGGEGGVAAGGLEEGDVIEVEMEGCGEGEVRDGIKTELIRSGEGEGGEEEEEGPRDCEFKR